jgi:hypothetical protein
VDGYFPSFGWVGPSSILVCKSLGTGKPPSFFLAVTWLPVLTVLITRTHRSVSEDVVPLSLCAVQHVELLLLVSPQPEVMSDIILSMSHVTTEMAFNCNCSCSGAAAASNS